MSGPNRMLKQLVGDYERVLIEKTLFANDFDIGQTARALGISRSALWYKMKRHKILKDFAAKDGEG